MKRGNTRTLNKRLQNLEERLLGPRVEPITVVLIDTFSPKEKTDYDKAKLCSQHKPVLKENPLNIKIIENFEGQNPSSIHITEHPPQPKYSTIMIETIDNY